MGRLSSAVERPERRRVSDRENGRDSPPSHNRRILSRSRSRSRSRGPVGNGYNRYRRSSPDYSYPNHDQTVRSTETREFDRDNRGKPYFDRDYNGNRKHADSESDEELKGLGFEEYRRLKRQKLRKMMRYCIWNCTPSPPRNPNEKSDDELEEEKVDPEDGKKIERSKKSSSSSGSESESGTEDSESDSDDSSRNKRKSKKRSSKRKRWAPKKPVSDSESDDSSSEEDSEEDNRRRRKRKSRQKSRRSRKSSSSRRKKSSRKSESDTESNSDDDSDVSDRVKNKRASKRSKKKRESESDGSYSDKNISDSEPKAVTDVVQDEVKVSNEEELLKFTEMLESRKKSNLDNDEPMIVGPMPLPKAEGHISYGGALRPGEGDAIAQYVQQGKRIPRRGEVGLSAEEISKFESLGYVMSGSRHQRMNAIRIRKENQVYSAEDKRALAMFNYEEKAKREQKVMADLQRLVQRHIGQDVGPAHDPFGGRAGEGGDDE